MSEVNRYDIGGMADGGIDVQQFPDGYWVKHEDYAELEAQRDALAALTAPEDWKQRAEAAESKLAELDSQVPIGWMTDVEVDELHSGVAEEAYIYAHADATSIIPLFTRPAPAVSLAELVPDEKAFVKPEFGTDPYAAGRVDGFNLCRAAILRNIEEEK